MSMLQSTLHITDRFYEACDPESVERHSRMQNCIMLVFIVHMMAVLAFIRLQAFEEAHPRIIQDVDVSFEFTPPPPEPSQVLEVPRALDLIEGANSNPGAEAQPKLLDSSEVPLPTLPAPQTAPPNFIVAKPMVLPKATYTPPVALTPVNIIKSPLRMTSPSPVALGSEPMDVGSVSLQTPDELPIPENENGVAKAGKTGEQANGGAGIGMGYPGAGTGEVAGGTPIISTRLDAAAKIPGGTISPWRKAALLAITKKWRPKKNYRLVVLVEVAQDGQLLSSEILDSNASRRSEREALEAVNAAEFPPLPHWYRGQSLRMKLDLTSTRDEP